MLFARFTTIYLDSWTRNFQSQAMINDAKSEWARQAAFRGVSLELINATIDRCGEKLSRPPCIAVFIDTMREVQKERQRQQELQEQAKKPRPVDEIQQQIIEMARLIAEAKRENPHLNWLDVAAKVNQDLKSRKMARNSPRSNSTTNQLSP